MSRLALALLLPLGLGLAARGSAIDLTGTWQEVTNATCKGMAASGDPIALKNRDIGFATLELSQNGSDLVLYQPGYLFSYEGWVHGEPGGVTGQGILQKCSGDANVLETYRILKAKTFPANSKGVSGKMTTLYVFGQPGSSYSCNVTWERVSTEDPGGVPCN